MKFLSRSVRDEMQAGAGSKAVLALGRCKAEPEGAYIRIDRLATKSCKPKISAL
jgi:hypothetical protein